MMRSSAAADPAWKGTVIPVTAWRESAQEMIGGQCQYLSDAHPRIYLLFVIAFALAGYAGLLLFPWLVVTSGLGLYEQFVTSQYIGWSQVLFSLVVGAFSILASYRIYRFRPALPAGRVLDHDSAPALFRLVASQSRYFHSTGIDRIVLTGEFGLDILKTPSHVLPVWSTNTLMIGLPLMQCLSVSQFECALARRLGQFSKRYNRLENWLYQLRDIWPQYCDRTRKHEPGYQPVGWLFCFYAPLYKLVAAPAACLDELAADHYAMELFNDEKVLETITTQMVCNRYLDEKYWPVVRKYAASNQRILDKLHSGMAQVLRSGLQADSIHHWIVKTMSAEDRYDDAVPSLARRVDNIGFGKPRMGPLASESAASVYLGNPGNPGNPGSDPGFD